MSPSVHPSDHLEYENTQILNIGIKIRVSTWSFLCVVRPLQIPIPMCEKKIRVQPENQQKITYCLRVLPTKFLHYVPYTRGALMGWRNFSRTVEKKFLQPMRSGCFCTLRRKTAPKDLDCHIGAHQLVHKPRPLFTVVQKMIPPKWGGRNCP